MLRRLRITIAESSD